MFRIFHNKILFKYLAVAGVCVFFICVDSASCDAVSPPASVGVASGTNSVILNWKGVEEATVYSIYRKRDTEQSFVFIDTTSDTHFSDTTVTNNQTYQYYVTASDALEESEPSATVVATPRAAGQLAYFRMNDFIYYFTPWIMDDPSSPSAQSSEQELVLTEGWDTSFSFSLTSSSLSSPAPVLTPDRQWLIYSDGDSLKRINVLTRKQKIIVPQELTAQYGFDVSPDGKRVVYVKTVSGKNNLYLRDIEGGNEEVLLANNKNNRYPSFSHDGLHVVYVTKESFWDDIYRINVTTKSTTAITSTSRAEFFPCYSPDDSAVAFHAFNSSTNSYDIYVYTIGGSTINITNSAANDYYPAWSPDGNQIAFITAEAEVIQNATYKYFHIAYKNADGSGTIANHSPSTQQLIRTGLTWTGSTDAMPPSPIVDCEVGTITDQTVELIFSTTGDDGMSGQASEYLIVYAQNPITSSNWEDLPQQTADISPHPSGSIELATVSHLKADTLYYIGVAVIDDTDNISGISNVVTAQTMSSSDLIAPDPPANVSATARDFLHIQLKWNHSPSPDVTGYNIYRNNTFLTVTDYEDSYTDTVAQNGVTYSYRLTAVDANGNESATTPSAAATSADNTIPPAPQWLRAHNTTSSVRLSWEAVAVPDIAGYKIYRNAGSGSIEIATTGNQTTYTDTGATIDTTYDYSVKSYDTAGNISASSDSVEGTPGWPDNKRTLVIMNSNNDASVRIGQYYQAARNIPSENMVFLDVPDSVGITIQQYLDDVHDPISQLITTNNLQDKIKFIVTTYGVPIKVGSMALDDVLTDFYNPDPDYLPTKPEDVSDYPHDYYLSKKRIDSSYAMILTARLDGPNEALIKALIDKAVYAEQFNNVTEAHTTCIDLRNITPSVYSGYYAQAERFIGTGILTSLSTTLNVNTSSALFAKNSCSDVQYYYGWYSYWNFIDIFQEYLRPGSIAGHLDSASFYSVRDTGDNNWGIHLLERGATAVYGAISEPYTMAFPCSGILYDRLKKGFNLAEAYWSSTNTLRWRMILIGDPLYNPFAQESQNDSAAPVISNIDSAPSGFRSYVITWDTNEAAEHAVTYSATSQPERQTEYTGWFSRSAHIVISPMTPNVAYTVTVQSRDASGNETISSAFQVTYTDADNDGLEDSWETMHFDTIITYDGSDDPDGDTHINLDEFTQGSDPNHADIFLFQHDTATKLSFSTYPDRIYRIYYSASLNAGFSWSPAGPYRLGTGNVITWTDDGRNTGSKPQSDPPVETRFYRITAEPLSR